MKTRRSEETRGVRRTQAQRAQVLREYRTSGLTQAEFARQAGINLGTLRGWIYQRPVPGGEAPGPFAPVRLVGDGRVRSDPPARGGVTVRWPQGIEVEMAVALDGAGIGRLIRTLLGPCLR